MSYSTSFDSTPPSLLTSNLDRVLVRAIPHPLASTNKRVTLSVRRTAPGQEPPQPPVTTSSNPLLGSTPPFQPSSVSANTQAPSTQRSMISTLTSTLLEQRTNPSSCSGSPALATARGNDQHSVSVATVAQPATISTIKYSAHFHKNGLPVKSAMKSPALASGHTVDDLLRTAEQRLSQTSSEHGRQTDLVDGAPKPEKSTAGDENKRPAAAARLETRIVSAKSTHKTESDDAGPGWFGLPRTQLTPALRRDFQVLRLRGALDPKVHYKKSASKSQFPRYSHVGEVVEGPTEFNSARLTKRERKSTFAEEVLSARGLKDRSKMKYSGIQERKTSGKKAYYKATRRQPRT